MKTFKIIVQPTRKCLELLRYVNGNLDTMIRLGARIQIEKIDESTMDESITEIFRKNGITRLPVLITPDGKLFIGTQQIIGNFEKTFNSAHTMELINPRSSAAEMGSNPDVTDFWIRELYSGYDSKNGKMVPRNDKDEEEEDEAANIEKKMSDYRRNVPHHRQGTSSNERDYSPPPARPRRTFDEDNIADETDATPKSAPKMPRYTSTGDAKGDDMDQRMLAAWMDNNNNET